MYFEKNRFFGVRSSYGINSTDVVKYKSCVLHNEQIGLPKYSLSLSPIEKKKIINKKTNNCNKIASALSFLHLLRFNWWNGTSMLSEGVTGNIADKKITCLIQLYWIIAKIAYSV